MIIKLWEDDKIPYYREDIDFIPYITPYIKEGAKGQYWYVPEAVMDAAPLMKETG